MHVGEPVSAPTFARCVLTIVGILLVLPVATASQVTGVHAEQLGGDAVYTQPSWGLGVVVPNGSPLVGGGKLAWATVGNVSVEVKIPRIANASDAVYVVLSLMTEGGVVMQEAFGLYPSHPGWWVYAMYIADISQIPQHYTWVANSSAPEAVMGDIVSLSIFRAAGQSWSFGATNLNTTQSVQGTFGAEAQGPLKGGDQEVIALESYSSDPATFQDMGNMTLTSILADGIRVSSGLYPYGQWNLLHSPLFTVGGGVPPLFADLMILKSGEAVWSYLGSWQNTAPTDDTIPVALAMVVLLTAALGGVLLSMRYVRKPAVRRSETGVP